MNDDVSLRKLTKRETSQHHKANNNTRTVRLDVTVNDASVVRESNRIAHFHQDLDVLIPILVGKTFVPRPPGWPAG